MYIYIYVLDLPGLYRKIIQLTVIVICLYRGSVADTGTSNSKWQIRKHKNIDVKVIHLIFQ